MQSTASKEDYFFFKIFDFCFGEGGSVDHCLVSQTQSPHFKSDQKGKQFNHRNFRWLPKPISSFFLTSEFSLFFSTGCSERFGTRPRKLRPGKKLNETNFGFKNHPKALELFSYNLLPRGRKNHCTLLLNAAGIEPALPAQQSSALPIAPLPLCL